MMREKLNKLFYGRQGMDELSKALFWAGLALAAAGCLLKKAAGLSDLLVSFGMVFLLVSFFRAFSRNLQRRELENYAYLNFLNRKRNDIQVRKERFALRKEYRFFKCPGCGTIIRVPTGKGRIHIKCRCGYTLYRKT